MQCRFGAVPFDTLVAISDQAVIDRDKGTDLPQVYKADQIPDAVRDILAKQRRAASIFNINIKDSGVALVPADFQRVREFLLANQCNAYQSNASQYTSPAMPLKSVIASAAIAPAVATQLVRCRHCHAESVSILYGRYGYYFKCSACSGNTAITLPCPRCETKTLLRKDGLRFYAECATCATSVLFFANRSEQGAPSTKAAL